MSPAKARRLAAEAERRAAARRSVDIAELCFPAQRAFVEDDSPFVVGLCGRRAGKSDGALLKAIRAAQRNPGTIIPYIALSRPHAKRIVWPKMHAWNRRLGLGAKFNAAELTMTLPRGGTIALGGANDETEIERYRGGAFPLVILDEAQAYRSFLPAFVTKILMPTLLDYDGQLVLIGTPNAFCHGYFHDVSNPDGEPSLDLAEVPDFSIHRWTGFDNPNLDKDYREGNHSDFERALETTARKIGYLSRAIGLTEDNPTYRQEWLAEWVRDNSGLVYKVGAMNIVEEPPDAEDLRYVLGMDVGFVDATAFVVMAYSLDAGAAWVVESFQETEMLPSQQAAEVLRLGERYDFESVVIDPGGGGKGLVEELAQRHGLPAKVAAKSEKVAAIETLNSDFRANTLRVYRPGNEELLHDLSQLKWDYARLEKRGGAQWKMKPISALAIDDRTPDHLADAFLYAHRECLHYINEYRKESPRVGSPEWWDLEEDRLLQKALRSVDGEGGVPWWEDPRVPGAPAGSR